MSEVETPQLDTSSPPEEGSLRDEIGKAMTGFLTPEQARKLVEETLSITKVVTAEFSCKKCGQRQKQPGQMSDARAVAAALKDLANQAFGPAAEARGDSSFEVIRNVYVIADPGQVDSEEIE